MMSNDSNDPIDVNSIDSEESVSEFTKVSERERASNAELMFLPSHPAVFEPESSAETINEVTD